MRWSGLVVLTAFATLYLLLSIPAEGFLQGLGYVAAALLYVLAFLNLVKPRK
jgi:hypothetical protein